MKNFYYRVGKDETVFSISQKVGVPPIKIIKDNNLKKDVCCGDLLYLTSEDSRIYKVRPNDTISSIARAFNILDSQIMQKNGILYVFYGLVIYV